MIPNRRWEFTNMNPENETRRMMEMAFREHLTEGHADILRDSFEAMHYSIGQKYM
jgi:hypothetical protein